MLLPQSNKERTIKTYEGMTVEHQSYSLSKN